MAGVARSAGAPARVGSGGQVRQQSAACHGGPDTPSARRATRLVLACQPAVVAPRLARSGSRLIGRKGTASQRSLQRTGQCGGWCSVAARLPPLLAGLPGDCFRPPVVGAHEPERQRLLCPHHPPPRGQGGRHRLRPCHWFLSPPIPLAGALQRSAARAVGRPPRAPAGAASARCGGRPFPSSAPRPPLRRRRARAPAGDGLRGLRAAPAPRLPPRGRPGGRKPPPGPAE